MKNSRFLLLIIFNIFNFLKPFSIKIENGLDSIVRFPGYEKIAAPGQNIVFSIDKNTEKIVEDFIYFKKHEVIRESIRIYEKKLIERFILKTDRLDLRLVFKNDRVDLLVLNPIISIKNNTKYTVFFEGKHFLPGKQINIILSKDIILCSERFVFVENRDESFSEGFCIWDKIFNEQHFLEFIQEKDAVFLIPRN
jgi:hypothetical protein